MEHIKTFNTREEADMAYGFLKEREIPSIVRPNKNAEAFAFLAPSVGGPFELYVDIEFVERALDALENIFPTQT